MLTSSWPGWKQARRDGVPDIIMGVNDGLAENGLIGTVFVPDITMGVNGGVAGWKRTHRDGVPDITMGVNGGLAGWKPTHSTVYLTLPWV